MKIPYLLELAANQLWIGAVVALLVWVFLSAWRGWSAESRYWVWTATLVVVAALPLLGLIPWQNAPLLPELLIDDTRAVPTVLIDSPQQTAAPATAGFNWTAALAVLWLAGFSWRVFALLAGSRTLRAWVREARAIPPHALPLPREALADCEIRESAHASVPRVAGFVKPCILVPIGLQARLPRTQLALVLSHEVAHARRGDSWFLLLQRLIEAIYFYNPVIHFIARRIERERECSCDDRALGEAHDHRTEYAECLLGISRDALRARAPTLAVGALRRASELGTRVERLLDESKREPSRFNAWHVSAACSMLALSGAVASLIMPRAHADAATPSRADDAPARSLVSRALASEMAETAITVDQARELIGAGADVNYVLQGDGTPLILAAQRGDMPMVQYLLAEGAEVDRFAPGDGNPLIAASAAGHLPIVRLLIDRGASVDAFDVYDESPLINAARSGHVPVVDYLLEKGADVNLTVQSQTVHGVKARSALSEARESGHDAVVQRLLRSGAAR